MKTIDVIQKKLIEEFGNDRVVTVSTKGYDLTTNPKGRNSKKDRRDWADSIFRELFDNMERSDVIKERRCLGSGEYNFSYVKFAINKNNEIVGVVHGKSSFHCMYPSDVWFYDFDDGKKNKVKELFEKQGLSWYTDEIIIIKNKKERFYE